MGQLLSICLTSELKYGRVQHHPAWQGSSFRVSGEMASLPRSCGSLITWCLSTSWNMEGGGKVRADSIKYITAVLAPVSLAGNPVMATSLQFIDRYTFNGESGDAKAELLFVKDNEYISARCFTAGSLWHCHTGWFDSPNPAGRVLNQLNVGSSVVDQASTVTIEHRVTLHLSTPRQSFEALLDPPDGSLSLGVALDTLHDKNKSILGVILQPEMIARIGMET